MRLYDSNTNLCAYQLKDGENIGEEFHGWPIMPFLPFLPVKISVGKAILRRPPLAHLTEKS